VPLISSRKLDPFAAPGSGACPYHRNSVLLRPNDRAPQYGHIGHASPSG